jgi:hypothetical protein
LNLLGWTSIRKSGLAGYGSRMKLMGKVSDSNGQIKAFIETRSDLWLTGSISP